MTMRRVIGRLWTGVGAMSVAACAPVVATVGPTPVPESRFYDTKARAFVDFRTFADAAAEAEVVFFGEQHDDPATHRAELALLAAVGTRRPNVVLSLEMFDRDNQSALNAYLAGQLPESAFVANAHAWPRYTTDYRALVELARANGWPVVAANPARRFATAVSRVGIAMLDTLSAGDRAMIAREVSCPHDMYFEKFAKSILTHSAGGGPPTAKDSADAAAMTNRFYEAQCIKDETMGESIAAAFAKAGQGAIVVHFNGAFHTDGGMGTAARARRRMSNANTLVVTAVPVDDIARADASAYADRGDYVILTPKPPKPR